MGVELASHQIKAIRNMKNGCILVGGTGSGKSRTSLAYFCKECEATLKINGIGNTKLMKSPRDLYIITTAKKRDSKEWEDELIPFQTCFPKKLKVTIDSWNNIKKYKDCSGAFFIFDEQRVVGSGAWVKAFLNITRKNKWILLSATPGDTYSDYIPVFVANGFYKNKTQFNREHVIYSRFTKFPKIDRYINTKKLDRFQNDILVTMDYKKPTKSHKCFIPVSYDKNLYSRIWKDRWNIYDNEPIEETGKLFYLLRRVVNSDPSREVAMFELLEKIPRAIIFYNFDYELEILKSICEQMKKKYAEWNGKHHNDIPKSKEWVYLVQYNAGAEGWNCTSTDSIIFYSLSYSYRSIVQAEGRIDRFNTKYVDLYYYFLKSPSPIDIAISRALKEKRNFNEKSFLTKRH